MNVVRRPLGDAPDRSYAAKLEPFAHFAEPELRRVIDDLGIRAGSTVLDAGCGVGRITRWLAERVGVRGTVIGLELSMPHLRAAGRPSGVHFIQSDVADPCIREYSVDFVWCSNAINHLANPAEALARLGRIARPGGKVALVQSALLPEMYFAWDARLEDEVRRACYAYYREKYGLSVADTTSVRRIVGLMVDAGLSKVSARTYVIERIQPLSEHDRSYFREVVFDGYWGTKLRPYLAERDWFALQSYCDPESSAYCLNRSDFHHIQSLTVVQGSVAMNAA